MTTCQKNRKRILLVVDSFPSETDPVDALFIADQASALAVDNDVGVVVIRTVSPRQWLARRGRASGDRVSSIGNVPVYWNETFVPTARCVRTWVAARRRSVVRAVDAFARRFGTPQVLHAHCAAFAGEAAVAAGQSLALPVVITEHYSFVSDLVRRYSRRLLDTYDRADRVIAVSTSLAERMHALGIARPIDVVPNTVDTQAFSYRPIAMPTDGTWQLLCIARDHAIKDLPTLLHAVALLEETPKIRLTIAGAGTYDEPRALCEEWQLTDRVHFAGPLTREQVAAQMAQSHLILSSSRLETFGMTLAEALCVGRPVVATDSGGPRDIIERTCGRLVPTGDAHALADAIKDVLQEYETFDQEAIAASAQARFGAQAFAQKLDQLYAQLTTSGPPSAPSRPVLVES